MGAPVEVPDHMKAFFGWLFGCHHHKVSRVFTIQKHTYQVCLDCGTELAYSWDKMLAHRPTSFTRLTRKRRWMLHIRIPNTRADRSKSSTFLESPGTSLPAASGPRLGFIHRQRQLRHHDPHRGQRFFCSVPTTDHEIIGTVDDGRSKTPFVTQLLPSRHEPAHEAITEQRADRRPRRAPANFIPIARSQMLVSTIIRLFRRCFLATS